MIECAAAVYAASELEDAPLSASSKSARSTGVVRGFLFFGAFALEGCFPFTVVSVPAAFDASGSAVGLTPDAG